MRPIGLRRGPRRAASALAIVPVLVGALSSPAQAGRRVIISGGGWGHGIGMSQYGAYGRALNGRSATEIVEHYYSGARVRRVAMPPHIRVGLQQGRSSVSATSSAYTAGGGRVVLRVAGKSRIAAGGAGTVWRIEPAGKGHMRVFKDGVRVRRDGRSLFGSPSRAVVMIYQRFGTVVRLVEKGIGYAYGRLRFGTYASSSCGGYCLRTVVQLSMQKYLFGLGEVPASWPQAALRAQAIAGRTYAYEKITRSGQHRQPCDCAVYDSTYDQAYIGDAKRTGSGSYWDAWRNAVKATRGDVILYGGAPIQALYSSSSGGHTESNENVWGGTPLPYLRGVRDRPDAVAANPNHKWVVTMRWRAFSRRLNQVFNTGALERFRLLRPFGVSGRVTVVKDADSGGVKIVGTERTVRASGWSIRQALGLKDTLFRVSIQRD